jgi:endonuclease YncB( thermonuclease family)
VIRPPGPVSARDTSTLRPDRPEGSFRSAPSRRPAAAWSAALGAGAVLALASAVAEPAMIRGTPEVLDGRRMVVAGQDIVLADIEVPALGEPCRIRGNPLDCGILARAGFMDIVAGSEVTCSAVGHGRHRCFADGYDIGFGLIHAGWAVPANDAPGHYTAKMTEARERGRGLWSAIPETGDAPTMAHRLHP